MKRLTRRSAIGLQFSEDEKRSVTSSFGTKFSLPTFIKRVEKLTNDQKTAITRTGFGSLLNIHDQLLSRSLLAELMDRWDCDKQAFKLVPGVITITIRDVAMILGLRVVGKSVLLNEDEPFSDIEQEYGATAVNRKIDISSIEEKLELMGEVADEDFVRSFLLFTFGVILFPNASGKDRKLDSRYVSMLRDLDKVHEFAWGEAVLQDLVKWLSKRKADNLQSIGGCLLLLQVWSYEHIDIGRPNMLNSVNFPRSCRWESSRSSLQRQGFCNKFDELEERQITWILQPSMEEAEIGILKELLKSELPRQDNLQEPSSSSSPLIEKELLHSKLPVLDHLIEDPSPSPLNEELLPLKSPRQHDSIEEPHLCSSPLIEVNDLVNNYSPLPTEVKDSMDTCSPSMAQVADSLDSSHPIISNRLDELKFSSDEEVADSMDSSHTTINVHLHKLTIEADEEIDGAVNLEHASRATEASTLCRNEYSEDPPCSAGIGAKASLRDEPMSVGKTTELKEVQLLLKSREEEIVKLREEIVKLKEEIVKLKEENEESRDDSGVDLVGRRLDQMESWFDGFAGRTARTVNCSLVDST